MSNDEFLAAVSSTRLRLLALRPVSPDVRLLRHNRIDARSPGARQSIANVVGPSRPIYVTMPTSMHCHLAGSPSHTHCGDRVCRSPRRRVSRRRSSRRDRPLRRRPTRAPASTYLSPARRRDADDAATVLRDPTSTAREVPRPSSDRFSLRTRRRRSPVDVGRRRRRRCSPSSHRNDATSMYGASTTFDRGPSADSSNEAELPDKLATTSDGRRAHPTAHIPVRLTDRPAVLTCRRALETSPS